MIQIRQGVFETNSSSTHSITICTKKEYEAFENGELMFDEYFGKLVNKDAKNKYGELPISYKKFQSLGDGGFVSRYKTEHGDEVVAFGYYAYDN
jgi:hypothetical protein